MVIVMTGNRMRAAMKVVPIIGAVASAVLILIGRTQRITPVAIAGYLLLALSAVLYLYLRSRQTG
jgi:predicted membrane channel-forming protein YqfA (hemolysin III family)